MIEGRTKDVYPAGSRHVCLKKGISRYLFPQIGGEHEKYIKPPTMWAPTSTKWSYNSDKWPKING